MRIIVRVAWGFAWGGLLLAQKATVTNSYAVTNLSSDIPGLAVTTDPFLVNPWGLSKPASSTAKEAHWWAADEHTGVSTLYDADGSIPPLTVTIPAANGTGTGSPTGTVALGKNFVFVTTDGTISEWLAATGPPASPFEHASAAAQSCSNCHTTSAVVRVNRSASGAVYTGCTLGTMNGQTVLLAASATGGVEAYDTNFQAVTLGAGAFQDPNVPAGFTPYGIQSVGKRVYVTFAPPPSANGGYVDGFDMTGKLLVTLQNGSWMDGPWGIAQAPANFGAFSNTLLVGNVGSGQIVAFNPRTGKVLGILKDATGRPIAIPGMWGISFGAGNADSGPVNVLYFNAGIQNFTHGLFGSIAAN